MASGWMRVRQRARQRNVELPLIISDRAIGVLGLSFAAVAKKPSEKAGFGSGPLGWI